MWQKPLYLQGFFVKNLENIDEGDSCSQKIIDATGQLVKRGIDYLMLIEQNIAVLMSILKGNASYT